MTGKGRKAMQFVTRERVMRKIRRLFPDQDPAEILEILDLYGIETYEREEKSQQPQSGMEMVRCGPIWDILGCGRQRCLRCV